MDDIPKIVVSSTLTEPLEWKNTRLIRGDALRAIQELKATGDRPLATIGSLSLARSLLEAGLVDRFRVVVFPVITGRTGQERIYDGRIIMTATYTWDIVSPLDGHGSYDSDLAPLDTRGVRP